MNKLFANAICTFIPNREKRGMVRSILTGTYGPRVEPYVDALKKWHELLPAVKRHMPALGSSPAELMHDGNYPVFRVDDTIFKFMPEIAAEKEEAAQRILRTRIKSIAIPDAKVFLDGENSFICYDYIPGSPPP